jgi:hypothetical protein
MKQLLFITLTCALAAVSSRASANTWTMAGAGCAIDPSTVSLAVVTPGSGTVAFATGATGTIKLICPVTGPTSSNPTDLYATYYDTDGTGTTCTIEESLYSAYTNTGNVFSTVAQWNNTESSYLPTNSSPYKNLGHYTLAPYTWDWTLNYYWIEVDLTRSATTCNTTLLGVALYQ